MRQFFLRIDKIFIVKRIGILVGITCTVLAGHILPQEKVKVSAYYSSFVEMASFVKEVPQDDVDTKILAVLSAEVGESSVPSLTPTPTKLVPEKSDPAQYKAKQIDQYTWTVEAGDDGRSATAGEIHIALNVYRKQKGKGELSWDQKLGDYAQSRVNGFSSNNKLDSHAGFQDFINNQDGFTKLGFFALGENSSIGYNLTGTNLIEKVYAGDKPHDDNQLNTEWSHVGIGVSGNITNLIFGGRKQ